MHLPRFWSLIVGIMLIYSNAHSQRIENVKAMPLGEKVIVNYDITSATDGQKFKVQLFSSHNNFSSPLTMVSGDLGLNNELFPGTNKRIEWDAKSELVDFEGEIIFEVRSQVIAALYSMLTPAIGTKMKKGKTYDISWRGGSTGETVTLELLKSGITALQITSVPNSGRFSWKVPDNIGKGDDYQVRLTAHSRSTLSNNFTIKKKTSLLIVALPVVAVGGILYFLGSGGGGGGGGGGSTDLPVPPEPN